MPHINRIRVNNVKYNFGTQFYDDFILRFDGKNALYDLANGGGKSVLMLLLFQNLIPNCTLDDKQPIEKLFRTDQGSRTIHSLIEWKLDERFVKDNFKYMLTGFCARKAREELRETAAIEYFNYAIFYRGYNDNDLVNLPLSDGKERVTYTGLKTYLRELGRRDMGLEVHIFERKGEYQRFISQYGLYESHWEILRGINKTEGHVRTYFENRYKTTRKVVEDLLIEEIIQRAFRQNSSQDGDMADTLVQIKDKLAELAGRKEEISYYDRQAEILESFSGRVELLKNIYEEKESFDTDVIKTFHTVTAINRLKEKELAVCQKEKEYAEKHIREISRKLDTVKIQESQEHLTRLEADTEKYSTDLQRMKEELAEKERVYALAESANDYSDYLKVKGQWEALKEYLAQDGGDSDSMLKELQNLARIRFAMNQEESQILNKKIWLAEKAYGEAATLKADAQEKERKLFSDSAVFTNQQEEAEKREKALSEELTGLCRQVPILVLENIGKTYEEKKQLYAANMLKISSLTEKQGVQEDEMKELSLSVEDGFRQQKSLEKESEIIKTFLDSYAREKKKRDGLLEIYGAEDGKNLTDIIRDQLRKTILDAELKGKEVKRLEQQLDNLRQGSPATISPAAEEVIEYIRRCHGLKCIFGGDYLKDISDEEKKYLLERLPFLPESVILESGMTTVKEDRVLLEKDLGGSVVPVISLNQVISQDTETPDKDVLFLSRDMALYVDPDSRKRAEELLEKMLKESRTALDRLADREKTIEADQYYMTGFELNYQQHYSERSVRWTQINGEKDEIKRILKKNSERIETLRSESIELEKNLKQLEQENVTLEKEVTILQQMKDLDAELRTIQAKIRQLENAVEKNEGQQRLAVEKLQWAEDEMKRLAEQKKSLQDSLKVQENLWQTLYEAYYTEGKTESSGLSREKVDARFKGLKEAYEKEHADVEDKKQLLESYRQMMETSLRMIDKRGTDREQLEKMAEEHQLILTDIQQLSEMEATAMRLRAEIEKQEEALFRYREDKNKLFGSVSHGVSTIEEKYGLFQQIVLQNGDYDTFIKQQRQALAAVKEKQEKAESGIQKTYRDLRVYDDIKRDLEQIIRSENLLFNRTKDTYGMDMDIHKKHRELNERYQRLRTELRRKQEGFERDRDKTIESLRLLSATELSEAVRTEAGMPDGSEEAALLMRQLMETAGIVRLEKERIEKTIHDMVQIKENFEKQCLQRCMSIRAELERFPAYSKIMLDGRQVPMVMLKIPYVKEEMYAQRMSEYIDAIVARTDTYSSQEERIAYIRQQLTWKRLFSVIVTDMNSIRLSLYKRERVKEQSRYLKYEEAVGSTGQSQGIYIQFLIGVINYISMVYSGGGDGGDLQKVIFIDNPFGAAKDIYIWQPIFELLRTNQVQLIVPTRGATPAITGKFDVNYVLGQKMIDKMQQTVVVDYSSNLDVASMEYEKLEFEQEVFDFI